MGRPRLEVPDNFPSIYEASCKEEITANKAMQELEISSSSFYRLVKKQKEQIQNIK